MRKYDLYGVGNAIVDLQMRVTEDDFLSLNTEKATMRLVDAPQQEAMLDRLKDYEIKWSSGGSVANSVIAVAQLGGKGAFAGLVGDDGFGEFYIREMEELGVLFHNDPISGKLTGTSAIVITPDSERTMRTHLGAASAITAESLDAAAIEDSEWFFFEGYLFDQEGGRQAARHGIEIAKKAGTKVALTCSEAFVIEHFGEPFRAAAAHADLLFLNQTEAHAFTGTKDDVASYSALKEKVPNFVITRHSEGAWARVNGEEVRVPAYSVQAIDATGAGDMFAGAFLYGLTHNLPVQRCTELACYLAARVVGQVGARLQEGARILAEKKGLL